jgi:hypothetical protein
VLRPLNRSPLGGGDITVDALPLQQVPQEVREDAAKRISDFVVGFVRLYETELGQDAELAGSGTLVQIDNTHGILTAYHVITSWITYETRTR